MKNIILLFVTSLLFTACSGGGGGGGGTNATPNIPAVANVSLMEGETHWGLLKPPVTKSKIFNLKNVSGFSSKTVSLAGLTGSFLIENDNCSNRILAANESCQFQITAKPQTSQTLTQNLFVKQDGTTTKTYSMAFIALDYTPPSLRAAQALLLPPSRPADSDGSWIGETAFDMGTTVEAALALIENQQATGYSLANLNSELTKTLNYLSKNGSSNINFATDKATVISQWARPNPVGGMKVREVLPFVLVGINKINNFVSGTNHSSFTEYPNYLASRRIPDLKCDPDSAMYNPGECNSLGLSDMTAHYSYIMDRNRWESTYSITSSTVVSNNVYQSVGELMLKDVFLLMKTLKSQNKTEEMTQLAKAAYANFARIPTDIEMEFGFKYEYSEEFQSSIFRLATIPQVTADFSTCRAVAYNAALLSMSYSSTDLDVVKKGDLLAAALPYLFMVLKNPRAEERTRCLPSIALAYSLAPKGLVSNAEKTQIYLELLNNLASSSGVYAGESPLILSEALLAISGFIY